MYLVSPDYLKTITGNNSGTRLPPPPKMARKARGQEKTAVNDESIKNTKKKKGTVTREYERWVKARATARREYDKWVKVHAKLHEADVERDR